jgi:hypothetical protein
MTKECSRRLPEVRHAATMACRRIRDRVLAAAFLATGLLSGVPASAEPVKIVSFEIGLDLQTEDGSGFYPRALYRALKSVEQDFTFSVLPLKRSIDHFARKAADCIWAIDVGSLAKVGIPQEGLVESGSLFTSELHLFMPPGVPAISDLSELEGKTVGVSIGSPVPKLLEGLAVNFFDVRTQDIKVRMLEHHRLDAAVAWVPDVLLAFRNNDMAPTAYNPALPIASSDVRLVCWSSPNTQAFLQSASPEIEAFRESGALREIMREFGIDYLHK